MTATDSERLARAALSRAVNSDRSAVGVEVARRGAVAVWADLRGRYPDVDPEHDLGLLAALDGRFICPGDPEWPSVLIALGRLSDGPEPEAGEPFGLWARGEGDLSRLCERAVAVVGSRAATAYGTTIAADLAAGLADRGWTIVSGAAFGIDAAAHHGALAAAGPTIAVLAGGVDIAYPRAHTELLARIRDNGLVVSEAAPGSPPYRGRFLTRNRIIAGLARGTVLVEAGHRSGALNTVRHARRLGRVVMAVPGPVTSAASVGCHRLLRTHREQTVLVTDAAEVCEEIGGIGELAEYPPADTGSRDGLPELVRRMLDVMPARSSVGAAVLAQRLGERPETVQALMGPLVVEGLVELRGDGYRLTALGRAPSAAGRAGAADEAGATGTAG
ncbi:DNA protecting protein DprA [Candidatus Protofrankia datiscae]|uniref:DNA protecting protein DprA n=3 Tax=Protofrankia TaxID=2994361 RepID=F8AVM6_9ACTN|nr:DNA-processing protein DprA [Candidatus Protofrankia datiscae]AEH10944.1 DNA protecting protein DprA [Candidatus Protofrankia datiscae]